MSTFNGGSFSDVANTPTGRALWRFLNSEDALIRLETSTYLQRPALEGLQPQLIERFGDEIRPNRWKQLIGKMTRQIMEERGYSLVRAGVRTRIRDLFTSAARYAK